MTPQPAPGQPRRSAPRPANAHIRLLQPQDFEAVREMGLKIYPKDDPWEGDYFWSHLEMFPEGQLVAVDNDSGRVLGYAASLVVDWDAYEFSDSWNTFTDKGYFTNHDTEHGKTLYGADLMVDPATQGRGIGKMIYRAREQLCRDLKLRRIRAGARLAGYHRFADQLSPREYVLRVIAREIGDPTLSFQLKQGFRVVAVVKGYMPKDPRSLGNAAVIEWINHQVAQPKDYRKRSAEFAKRRKRRTQPRQQPPPPPTTETPPPE